MHFATRLRPTSDTREAAPGSYPLSSVDRSSLEGLVDPDYPSPDVVDILAHLKVTPTRPHIAPSNSDSERSQKLKALPGCKIIRDNALKSTERWGKSFEQIEQEHLFEDLEPVEALKKKTNSEMLQQHFEAVVDFSIGIKSCFDEFQELRKPFDDLLSAKNTTVTEQAEAAIKLYEGIEQNKRRMGRNAEIIFGSDVNVWKFQETSVKETQDKIESILRAEHDNQEDIEFAIDLLKDGERIAPKVKEPSGLVAASLEGAAKYGLSKLAQRRKNKLLESKMLQATYRKEKAKVDALDNNLGESRHCLQGASGIALTLGAPIYTNICVCLKEIKVGDNDVSVVAIAETLDETEGKILTLLELIDDFLAQLTQDFGPKREFKRLCSRVPNIFTALDMLLSAKNVVADNYQHIYEKHIYEICEATLEHFNKMREVYWECREAAMSEERQATFLSDDVPDFVKSVVPHLRAIGDIARAHISKAKSKEAEKRRAKEDKFHRDCAWTRPGRSLVTGDEISWALYKVIDALLLIRAVSKASDPRDKSPSKKAGGTDGTATNGMEDGETQGEKHKALNGSLEWFKMPEEMLNQFYAVLFSEAKKLHFLKNKGERQMKSHEEPEPGGLLSRFRRLVARKPQ